MTRAISILAAVLAADQLAAAPARSEPPVLRASVAVNAIDLSARPEPRPSRVTPPAAQDRTDFQAWIAEFRGRALAAGITAGTFDRAMAGVRYDTDAIRLDRNQSEFTKTIWDYLGTAVSDTRIANGRAALHAHGATLDRIEAQYGVEKEIVAAIWGLESAYGAFKGSSDTLSALATLAHDGRRGAFFEAQLVAALRILQAGDTTPARMRGSWAGAMGHTQFMPTSFLEHAVDFTGDGRRDIWGDDPADALASTAAYLKGFGWTLGQPWGVEVRLPEGFDYTLASRAITRLPSDWARIGVTGMGGDVADHGPAAILLPAGARGAAFMIFDNFAVLERYNTADAYVIGVGHLADRLAGGNPIAGGWPFGDRALTYAERQELQRRLTTLGFDTQGVDGRIGPLTIDAIRDFQRAKGLLPDGYASERLLARLR